MFQGELVKVKSKIAISAFLISLIALIVYYFLIVSPKNELQKLSSKFEIVLRENNLPEIQKITLSESFINQQSLKGQELINKFESGILINKAYYAYDLTFFKKTYEKSIMGTGIMKAKIDSEERLFEIMAVEDKGVLKIASFSFPDLLDY